jgi:hypothetical protein
LRFTTHNLTTHNRQFLCSIIHVTITKKSYTPTFISQPSFLPQDKVDARYSSWSANKRRAAHFAKIGLYAVNMILGYLIMLMTMVYSYEMFLAVIIGLAIGHSIFNLNAPVAASATACCAGRNEPSALGGNRVAASGESAGGEGNDNL